MLHWSFQALAGWAGRRRLPTRDQPLPDTRKSLSSGIICRWSGTRRVLALTHWQTVPDVAVAIEEWLPRVLQALKGSFVDRNENRLFCHVLQRLRKTRDELPRLILPSLKEWGCCLAYATSSFQVRYTIESLFLIRSSFTYKRGDANRATAGLMGIEGVRGGSAEGWRDKKGNQGLLSRECVYSQSWMNCFVRLLDIGLWYLSW